MEAHALLNERSGGKPKQVGAYHHRIMIVFRIGAISTRHRRFDQSARWLHSEVAVTCAGKSVGIAVEIASQG